jgi:hypothetical protein
VSRHGLLHFQGHLRIIVSLSKRITGTCLLKTNA